MNTRAEADALATPAARPLDGVLVVALEQAVGYKRCRDPAADDDGVELLGHLRSPVLTGAHSRNRDPPMKPV